MGFDLLANVDFATTGGPNAVLAAGWSHPEPGFRWSVGSESIVEFDVRAGAFRYLLQVAVAPHTQRTGQPAQTLSVMVNGQFLGTSTVNAAGTLEFAIPLPVAALRKPIEVRFQHPHTYTPSHHVPSSDDRPLAFAFYDCRLLGDTDAPSDARLRQSPQDDDDLVPPADLLFDGSTTEEQFKALGNGFVRIILAGRAGLKPQHRVLDLGSGNGQKARPLTSYLAGAGSYEGLDVVAAGIDWCTTRYARFPNFRFGHADVYSSHYNPTSTVLDTQYRLPYADQEFDVVFLTSVFTHMLPAGIQNYINEISRVLKPGGRCVATFFLLNDDSTARIVAGGSSIAFVEVPGGFRVLDPRNPSKAVAVPEDWVRRAFAEADLRVAELTFGTWSGGSDLLAAYQDLIISVKA